MQNNAIHNTVFLTTNNQLHSQSPSSDCGTREFPRTQEFCQMCKFHRIRQTRGKRMNSRKVWTPRKERFPAPSPAPIYKLSMTSGLCSISIGQLALAVWLCSLPAPAQLLIGWIWETEKSPWFLSNNWKNHGYQHSSRTKFKTQQLVGRKISLSQPKWGQVLIWNTEYLKPVYGFITFCSRLSAAFVERSTFNV